MRWTMILAAAWLAGCQSEAPRSSRSAERKPEGGRPAASAAAQASAPKPATFSATTGQAGAAIDWDKAGAETLATLQDLIRYRTFLPDPESDDTQTMDLVQALVARFRAEGVEAEAVPGPIRNRGNLIARVRGDGSKRPLLLLAHLDTVPFDRAKWDVDPLAGTVKEDGYLYGRGAIDDKGMAATLITTTLLLARQKAALARDVILLLECDEEIGGPCGMEHVVGTCWDKIDAEFALNEGGYTLMREDGGVAYFGVQSAEKTPYNLFVTAKGTTGHGSVPLTDNPVSAIGRALSRLSAWRAPVQFTETTRRFLAALAKTERDPVYARVLENLLSPDSSTVAGAAAYVTRRDPKYGAMLRNTVSPTVLKGSFANNVIPEEATVVLNCRLMPGEDPKAFEAKLIEIMNEPSIRIEIKTGMAHGEAPSSSTDTDFFRAIEAAAHEMAPDAAVTPYMSTGATDSTDLRRKGVPSYGLLTMPMTEEDLRRMHGHMERVKVSSLKFGAELAYKIVMKAAGRN